MWATSTTVWPVFAPENIALSLKTGPFFVLLVEILKDYLGPTRILKDKTQHPSFIEKICGGE